MTREEEIVNAAREYTDKVIFASPSTVLYFEAGANWADQHPKNVWHSSEEEPKKNRYILIEVAIALAPKSIVEYYVEYTENTVVKIMKMEGFKCRWAYINDLLPKGGEK